MKIINVEISSFRSIAHASLVLLDYTVLFGPNNSGKSNLIEALLFYFDKIKLSEDHFHRKQDKIQDELWVEVTYSPEDPSELEELPEKYKLPGNIYRVRRSACRADLKPKYQGYVSENGNIVLDDKEFFGAKNVSKSKLGEAIHIPALRDISIETKTKGPAVFAKILKELVSDTLGQTPEYEALVDAITGLSKSIQGDAAPERDERKYETIAEIEKTLTEELEYWDCRVDISLIPPKPFDMVQSSADVSLFEESVGTIAPNDVGHGLQRALMIAFIKTWAEVERVRRANNAEAEGKSIFRPDLTILLFEEPEIYLCPPLQKKLFADLKIISNRLSSQVLVSSHSATFLSAADEDFRSLVRVVREGETSLRQVSDDLISVVSTEKVKRRFRFRLWLNADRNEAYFSDRVILVEGNSDKAVFQWLIEKNGGPSLPNAVTIVDCGGKANIPIFMQLYSELAIPHYVVHDSDYDKNEYHKKRNQAIQEARNPFTLDIDVLPGNLEEFLNLPKSDSYRKASEALYHLEENGIAQEKEERLLKALN